MDEFHVKHYANQFGSVFCVVRTEQAYRQFTGNVTVVICMLLSLSALTEQYYSVSLGNCL
jgi:hypothetical protein